MKRRSIQASATFLMALVGAIALTGATLSITSAQVTNRGLSVAGTANAGDSVLLLDATTGAVLGSARVRRDGTWSRSLPGLKTIPCRVRAESAGAFVERDVDGAPPSCNGTPPGKVLTAVTVSGPATVIEESTASYTAMASYSDGSTSNVTAQASWSVNSRFATIDAGVLTTSAVTSDQALIVSAWYAEAGVALNGTRNVTLQNVPDVTGSHAGRFTTYEGTKTCLACHEDEALAVHSSVHYQWQGDATESEGLSTTRAGKLGGINDFCIYPDINWLGKLTTTTGAVVDGGCARCHTGLGLKPKPEPTQEQLENIDCLLCHSPSYKRTVAGDQATGFRMVPDTAKMTVSLLQAAVDIQKPTSGTCLSCHTKAGGGNNFKRGDIEEAHRNATPAVDVHMAPTSQGGAGLSCTSCHVAAGHRIPGRGVDMRERDTPTPVECSSCHTAQPHSDSRLNNHTARVACNVCHVPSFAKVAPTDMRRDWSLPGVLSHETGLYEPAMELRTNVTPVYRFFNGRSKFYEFGQPAAAGENGRVLMAGPLGNVGDVGAKITAMKRHEGKQPIDPVTRVLLPLKIGLFFQSADILGAITQGRAAMQWPDNGHEFVETERYMGVYHEVAPKEQALTCGSCHTTSGSAGRLDFAALGYTPNATRGGQPLCSSCHGTKSNPGFSRLHEKHVGERKIDCSNCHGFSKAI
ncbi:MAG: hypothetical protein ACE148_11430 [Vicinamibacterales bacterium]